MGDKRFLDINMYFNDKEIVKTICVLKDSDESYEEILRVRDLYNEQDNVALPGTTLVNLLNRTDDIYSILENYIRMSETISVETQIHNLQYEIGSKLRYKPLNILVKRIFDSFIVDFDILSETEPSQDDLEEYKKNSEDDFCNIRTFYELLYKYVSKEIEDNKVILSGRFIFKVFIVSLLQDIKFIIDNCEKDIIEIPEKYQVDKYEIRTLKDLFYISKYQIQKRNKRIKRCKICNKYFVTKGNKTTEVYCRRKYKGKKYTCQEFGTYSKRKIDNTTYDLRGDLKRELNNTTTMLRKQDKDNNTNLKDDFMKRYKIKFSELEALEISEDEILQMKLDWLKEQHEILKKKNSHKI